MTETVTSHDPLLSNVHRANPPDFSDSLTGRTALITVEGRGLSAAITTRLAKQGASIAVAYGNNRRQAEDALAEITAVGLVGSIHQADVAVVADCRRVIAEVVDEHGSLDILVNTAGITIHRTVLNATNTDSEKALSVNLRGVSCLSQAAMTQMIEGGHGRIINVTSIPIEGGAIGRATYAASLSGLGGLTKSLAKEAAFMLDKVGRSQGNLIGITVNTVTGGFVDTEIVGSVPDDLIEELTTQIPLRRLARADEVARIVEFLAADASGYITGEVWSINGGMEE